MAGSFQNFQADFAEFNSLSIFQRREGVFRFCSSAEINFGADAIAEFEMAGDEVGVEMGEEDVLDLEFVFGGEGEVLIDVALRIDDGGFAGWFVADEVGGVGEAAEIELFEDHGRAYFGRCKKKQNAPTLYAWASWGAAMLRPYMTLQIVTSVA